MKAIILAAGRGSRLGTLTQNKPKPLTILAGKPLIEWQIEALSKAGIEDVTLVCGYQAQLLTPYGGSHIYNSDWDTSNMVRSLLCADDLLSVEPVLVCYGDLVYRHDLIETLLATKHELAITYDQDWLGLWSARFDDPIDDAESFKHNNNRLISIGQKVKDVSEIDGQYMGLLKFTPVAWSKVKMYLAGLSANEVDALDMTSLLAALIANGINIGVEAINGGWVEVDNPCDIALYESKIRSNGWHHDWRA